MPPALRAAEAGLARAAETARSEAMTTPTRTRAADLEDLAMGDPSLRSPGRASGHPTSPPPRGTLRRSGCQARPGGPTMGGPPPNEEGDHHGRRPGRGAAQGAVVRRA